MKTLAAICLLLISQALAEISVDVGDAERGVNLLNPRSGRPLYQLRVLDAQDTVEADDLVYVSLKANDNSRPITNFHVSIQSPDECGAGKIAHGIRGEEAPIKQDGVTVTTKVNVDWTKVPLRWRTPSCGCVTIRATVWESDSVYHQDEGAEGPLTRTLCIVVPDTESETVDSLEVEDEVASETEVEEAEVQGEDIDEDEEEEDPEEVFWRSPSVPKVKKAGGCRGQECPLHSVFIAPRGANTEQVDEVCLLLQNKPVNQEDMPAYLANRIQSLEVCCEMEGETRSTCINDLRSENVRDICEVSTKYTPHGRYGLSHPCCTGNSDDRLECFDQERNDGFDQTLHSANRTDELIRFHMTMKKIARMPYMPRMDASIVQRKCEWIMSRKDDAKTPHQFMKGYYKSQMMKYEVCCMKESQEDRISCVEELLRQKVDNYCVDRSLDREDPTNPRALEPINPCCHQPRSERYECFHQIANSSWSGKNSSRTCYKFLIKNYRTARQVWLDNIKPVLSPEEHGVLVSNKLWCMSEAKKSRSVPWFIAYSKFMAPRGGNTVAVDNICDITMATLTGEEPDLEDVPAEVFEEEEEEEEEEEASSAEESSEESSEEEGYGGKSRWMMMKKMKKMIAKAPEEMRPRLMMNMKRMMMKKKMAGKMENMRELWTQRRDQLQACCIHDDRETCFNDLRSQHANEVCVRDEITVETKGAVPNPCCKLSGQERSECMDQMRSGPSDSQNDFTDVVAQFKTQRELRAQSQPEIMGCERVNMQVQGSCYCQKINSYKKYKSSDSKSSGKSAYAGEYIQNIMTYVWSPIDMSVSKMGKVLKTCCQSETEEEQNNCFMQTRTDQVNSYCQQQQDSDVVSEEAAECCEKSGEDRLQCVESLRPRPAPCHGRECYQKDNSYNKWLAAVLGKDEDSSESSEEYSEESSEEWSRESSEESSEEYGRHHHHRSHRRHGGPHKKHGHHGKPGYHGKDDNDHDDIWSVYGHGPSNPLESAYFMAPRGTDAVGVRLACAVLHINLKQQEQEEDQEDSSMMFGGKWGDKWGKMSMKREGWGRKTLPSWKPDKQRLAKQRVSDLQRCCSATGDKQVSCFDEMRQTNMDQQCHFSLPGVSSVLTPCCSLSGAERHSCMDQTRYGFESQVHNKDYTKNTSLAMDIWRFMQLNMMQQRPPAFDEQTAGSYCQKIKRDSDYHVEESDEQPLVRLDPKSSVSLLAYQQQRCCHMDGQNAVACLAGIRERRLNQLCVEHENMDRLLDTLLEITEGNYLHKYAQEAVEYIKTKVPVHRCCRSNGENRMSCFAQEWRPYSPAVDTRDFSADLGFYSNQMNEFANVAYRWMMKCPMFRKMMMEPVTEKYPGVHKKFYRHGDVSSRKFVVPRGEDTERVEEVCKKVSWLSDNFSLPMPSNYTVSTEVTQRRVQKLGECCSMEETDRAECFDSLRQNSADEFCENQPELNRHLIPEHPCCSETGSNRLMCLDMEKYGYDADRHTTDFSEQLDQFASQKYVVKSLIDITKAVGSRKNASETKMYCAWKGKMAQKSDKWIKWGIYREMSDIYARKGECCQQATVGDQQQCLTGVFETRVDDFCSWLDKTAEQATSYVEGVALTQPDHVCCGMEGRSRYDCFGQVTSGGYSPYVDSRDFTDIIQTYQEQYNNFLKIREVQIPVRPQPHTPKTAEKRKPQWWEKLVDVRSPKFVAPRGEDEDMVQAICQKLEKPSRRSGPPSKARGFLSSLFGPREDMKEIIENRVADFQQCCSIDTDDIAACFDGLRQVTVDQHCDMEKDAPHQELDLSHPCCEVTHGRLECLDQQMYGYNPEVHVVDFSDQLHEFHSAMYKMKSMGNKWLTRFAEHKSEEKICEYKSRMDQLKDDWVKKMPRWGLWQQKDDKWGESVACCGLSTSEERQECLDRLRTERNDDYCQRQQDSSGDQEGTKIDRIVNNQPQHPCCQEEGDQRSDCFDQEVNKYTPDKHVQDFTSTIEQYETDFQTYLDDSNIKLPPWMAGRDEDSEEDSGERWGRREHGGPRARGRGWHRRH